MVPATVASAEGGTDGKKVRKTATRGMKARKKADSRVKRIRIRNLFKADGHKQ